MKPTGILLLLCFGATTAAAQSAEPLRSWNDGQAKQSITAFVARVTKSGSPDFVPVADRIATFDNDGTLWAEQPMYFQLQFGIDRPIAAFGNSHGDLQMLQWSCAGTGPRFCLFVRHTDADREWSYDVSPLGKLEKGLEEATAKGWTIVDMKKDWKVVYPAGKN